MVSVTDAHVHVVSSDTDRFPLRPGGFGRDWWTGRPVDAAAGHARPRRRGCRTGGDRAGGRAVRQRQPLRPGGGRLRAQGDSQSWSRSTATATIPRPSSPALADRGGVAGVRVAAFGGDAPWLTDGRGAAIWDAAADRGTNLVVACLAHHVPAVGELVALASRCHGRARPLCIPRSRRGPAVSARGCAVRARRAPGRPPEADDDRVAQCRARPGDVRALVARLVEAFGRGSHLLGIRPSADV